MIFFALTRGGGEPELLPLVLLLLARAVALQVLHGPAEAAPAAAGVQTWRPIQNISYKHNVVG